jgi:hypothetical protein
MINGTMDESAGAEAAAAAAAAGAAVVASAEDDAANKALVEAITNNIGVDAASKRADDAAKAASTARKRAFEAATGVVPVASSTAAGATTLPTTTPVEVERVEPDDFAGGWTDWREVTPVDLAVFRENVANAAAASPPAPTHVQTQVVGNGTNYKFKGAGGGIVEFSVSSKPKEVAAELPVAKDTPRVIRVSITIADNRKLADVRQSEKDNIIADAKKTFALAFDVEEKNVHVELVEGSIIAVGTIRVDGTVEIDVAGLPAKIKQVIQEQGLFDGYTIEGVAATEETTATKTANEPKTAATAANTAADKCSWIIGEGPEKLDLTKLRNDVAALLGDTIGAILSNAENKEVNSGVVKDLRDKLYGTAECAIMSVLKEAEACVCPDNAAAGATVCVPCGGTVGTVTARAPADAKYTRKAAGLADDAIVMILRRDVDAAFTYVEGIGGIVADGVSDPTVRANADAVYATVVGACDGVAAILLDAVAAAETMRTGELERASLEDVVTEEHKKVKLGVARRLVELAGALYTRVVEEVRAGDQDPSALDPAEELYSRMIDKAIELGLPEEEQQRAATAKTASAM